MSMSNQEAIEIIELARAQIEWDYHIDYAVAFDMAISALQAQELSKTQKPLDTISRQAAIDAFGDVHPLDYNAQAYLSKIKALPSAQPEIIRCKDCKWWSNDDYRECSNPNYDDGYITPAGFYCGYAERRIDG